MVHPWATGVVKETMYKTVNKILEEIEQWRENSSTDDTLTSLTSIETFLEEIREITMYKNARIRQSPDQ